MPPATTTICARWCSLISFQSSEQFCGDFSSVSVPSSTSLLPSWAKRSLYRPKWQTNGDHSPELRLKIGRMVRKNKQLFELYRNASTDAELLWAVCDCLMFYSASPDSSATPQWENSTVTQQGFSTLTPPLCHPSVSWVMFCLFSFYVVLDGCNNNLLPILLYSRFLIVC